MSSQASRPFSGAEFVFQDIEHRPVKFLRLRHAHAVNLEADDGKAAARKNFDHAAGARVGKFEIVRLDQDERLLDFRVLREVDHAVENAAVAVGIFRPELQVALDRSRRRMPPARRARNRSPSPNSSAM